MLKAGELAAQALELAGRNAVPGISTWELDRIVNDYVVSHGGSSPCKGYGGFPGHNCFSINEQLIHGIPSKKVILKEGDIISCDIVAELNGFMGDNTKTFRVGKVSDEADRLLRITEEALYKGIEQAISQTRSRRMLSPTVMRYAKSISVTESDVTCTRIPKFRTSEDPAEDPDFARE